MMLVECAAGTLIHLQVHDHPIFSEENVLMVTATMDSRDWICCVCLSQGRFFGWTRGVWPDAKVKVVPFPYTVGKAPGLLSDQESLVR